MKKDELKKLIDLVLISEYKDLLLHFFEKVEGLEYRCIKMDREYFLDVFGIRLKSNRSMGISIRGFEQLMQTYEASSAMNILSHSIEIGNDSVLVYTDVNITKIFGVVEPREVTFSQDRSGNS
ncbi:hypothetical protein ACDQ55_21445 [Chitinophaga sp. 30R24]|uniref:hypothetical protein n=1 Tax=Chitinophaga sp. 30R24 TaxID=3248838 RepID=UPI003B908109